jgi:hypothetical protein
MKWPRPKLGRGHNSFEIFLGSSQLTFLDAWIENIPQAVAK